MDRRTPERNPMTTAELDHMIDRLRLHLQQGVEL
jgi:hypothetical protein